jgi:hypothetical protein
VLRKGGKILAIPLAPRTSRAIELAIDERLGGPIFLRADGHRMDRHRAGRIVQRVARRAGLDKKIGPHTLRHAFITPPSTPASRCAVQEAASQADPRTTMRYDRAGSPSTGTPPTSPPPTLPERPAEPQPLGVRPSRPECTDRRSALSTRADLLISRGALAMRR